MNEKTKKEIIKREEKNRWRQRAIDVEICPDCCCDAYWCDDDVVLVCPKCKNILKIKNL